MHSEGRSSTPVSATACRLRLFCDRCRIFGRHVADHFVEVHTMPRKYGKSAQKSVKRAMHKRKHGTLTSGKKGTTRVKSRKQAIAIGLSEARKKGAKVSRKK